MNCKLYLIVLASLSTFFAGGRCANILMVSTLPYKSHHIWHETFALGLVQKGHNVTLMSHHEASTDVQNYTVILLRERYTDGFDVEHIAGLGSFELVRFMYECLHSICIDDIQSEGFARLTNYPANFRFDLIVWDVHVGQCMYPLMDRFGRDVPAIGTSPFGLQHVFAHMFGTPIPFYPFYLVDTTYDRMSYYQRFAHHVNVNLLTWYYKLLYLPAQFKVAKSTFGNDIPNLDAYERRFRLLLTNTDPLMDYALPLAPNVIPVAGVHIGKPKRMPHDVQKVLDDATDGAVYFALGSIVKPQSLAKFDRVLKAIAAIPYKILWKIDASDAKIGTIPKNVVVRKWFPQNDVLAHKNIKMFISHGGALSTQEAVYHGVPLVVIPLHLDQISNAMRLTDRKLAVTVSYSNLTTENLYRAAMEVLNNPMYKENAMKVSQMFKDQLNTPLERAVHWTEYVLKHKDVKHLDVITRDMYFYETLHLDLLLLMAFGLLLTIITIAIFTLIYYCYKTDSSKVKKS